MKFAAGAAGAAAAAAADRRGRVDVAALECDAWKPLSCSSFSGGVVGLRQLAASGWMMEVKHSSGLNHKPISPSLVDILLAQNVKQNPHGASPDEN